MSSLQIFPTDAVLLQFGFVQILGMRSSQIPQQQQCANDCAETADGSLDGDGSARSLGLELDSEVEDGRGYT